MSSSAVRGVQPRSLGKPTASYPSAIATDQKLAIAVDREQTTLLTPLTAVASVMTVTDASKIAAWSLLSIENEIVQVTGAPTGNDVPISRGFDGTTPVLHLAGATVAGLVDAYHHNALVAELQAIETALGPNLSLIPASPAVWSSSYDFPPQTPGGTLSPGNQVITLAPVPKGVNGTDKNHSLYISGGTGTAEAAMITGGTAVSGAASGTVIVTCANSHSGAWTIRSASAGIMEAIIDNPSREVHIPKGAYTMRDTLRLDPAKTLILTGEGSSSSSSFLNFGGLTDRNAIEMIDPTGVTSNERKILRNFNIQGTGTSTGQHGIYLKNVVRLTIDNLAVNSFAQNGIYMLDSFEITIRHTQATQNGKYGVQMDGVSNVNRLESCYFGANSRLNGYGGIAIVGTSAASPTESVTLDGVTSEGNGGIPFTTVTTTYGIFAQDVTGLTVANSYIEGNIGVDAILYQSGCAAIVEFNNWVNGGKLTYNSASRVTSFGNTFYGTKAYRDIIGSAATFNVGPDNCLNGSPECSNHTRMLGAPGSTGSGTPALGANCPATVLTAPYTWLKVQGPDGTSIYIPAWK